jgi:hypothetical protein
MDPRSLQAFLPVEAPAEQTTAMAGGLPAPSLQGLSIAQQARLLPNIQRYTTVLTKHQRHVVSNVINDLPFASWRMFEALTRLWPC